VKALILAGGENKRLPILKGFLELKGRKIIESNIELLKGIFDGVIISTNTPERYFYLGMSMVGDVINYRGPMTGILSALITLKETEIFVTACDMPFIKPELIRYIVGRWTDRWEAMVPVFDGKPQPLLGIYSRKLIPKMEESIKTQARGLREFLGTIEVHYIKEEEVRAIDPEGKSFVNINTIQDYEKERLAVGS
jgi:molybdopterin-guanine dinucleotide biosynthesis protein A